MHSNYTQPLIDALNVYVTPAIILFGLTGNLLTCLVFFRTPLKKHSASFYLGCLAIADAGYLLILAITVFEFHRQIDIYNVNICCQFVYYSGSVCTNWSVWLIVAFTIERYIALTYPLQRMVLCTVRKAKIITGSLFAAACCLNLHLLWVSGVNESGFCMEKPEFRMIINVANYVDTVLTFLAPTSIIIVLNALISRAICQYHKSLLYSGDSGSFTASTRSYKSKSERMNQQKSKRELNHSDSQTRGIHEREAKRCLMARTQCNITKLILLTSTVFLVLNIPSYIMRFILFTDAFTTENVWEFICAQRIFNVLYQANFSVNFLLYAMCGSMFRKALYTYLCTHVGVIKRFILGTNTTSSRQSDSLPKCSPHPSRLI